MAINFPSNPSNGAIFTDPSGQQWVYNSSDKSWTALGISVDPGGLQYQGGLDITAAPPAAQSGQFWSVSVGGTANGGFAPGVTGTIPTGSFVLYDGVNWEQLETSSLWNRTGGLIQPINQNDVIQTDSGLKVGPSGTPNITLNTDGSAEFAGSVSIEKAAPIAPITLTNNSIALVSKSNTGSDQQSTLYFRPLNASGNGSPAAISTVSSGNTNSSLAFYTNPANTYTQTPTEKMRIDDGGNVLIGGTLPSSPNISLKADGSAELAGRVGIGATPLAPLHVSASSSNNIFQLSRSDASGHLTVNFASQDTNFDSYNQYVFNQQGVEKARIDSSGNVLIGGTLPSAPNIELKSDGSVTAFGEIKAQQNPLSAGSNGFYAIAAGSNSDSNAAYLRLHSGGQIWATTGNLGLFIGSKDRTTRWANFTPTGNFLLGGTLPSAPNIELNAVGTGIFGSNPYQGAGTGVAVISSGTIRASAVSGTPLWQGYQNGVTEPTSSITAQGNVRFTGSVSIGGTAAANTIDKYEEGTWTPTIVDNGNAAQTAFTAADGRYRRIGGILICSVNVTYDTAGTIGTTTFKMNLPFNDVYGSGVLVQSNDLNSDLIRGFVAGSSQVRCSIPSDVTSGSRNYRGSFTFTMP